MTEVVRDLWRRPARPTLLLRKGHLEQVAQLFKEGRTNKALVQEVPQGGFAEACLNRLEHELYQESYPGLSWDLLFLPLPPPRWSRKVLTSLCQLPAQTARSSWQQQTRQMGWATCVCRHSVNCQPDHCLKASGLVSWGHWSQLAVSKLLFAVRLWTYT